MSTYIFDQAWERERDRLNGLATLYDEGTERVLSAAGVARGWRCLEIGGGTGTIARWLASQVGPQGQVVVTDVDVRFLDELDDERVKVRRHDIVRDDLEEGAFDLVHARLVIQHLSARECALKKAARALRRSHSWSQASRHVGRHRATGRSLRSADADRVRRDVDQHIPLAQPRAGTRPVRGSRVTHGDRG